MYMLAVAQCLLMSSARAPMYVCAICSVSNLESLRSLPRAGTTSRRRSKASFRLFMRRRSRALAAKRRFLTTSTAGILLLRRRLGWPAPDRSLLVERGVRVLRWRLEPSTPIGEEVEGRVLRLATAPESPVAVDWSVEAQEAPSHMAFANSAFDSWSSASGTNFSSEAAGDAM